MFRDQKLLGAIDSVASFKKVPKGELLMDVGGYIKFMPLVLNGLIKVMREDKEGNEILLYYLESGNTCAMSMSCCMQLEKSSIRAVAEEETEIVMIPVQYVDDWISEHKEWKHFILNTYSRRFDELLEAIDIFAFKKMDERLLSYLQKRTDVLGNNAFNMTHQEMALELNTSREVVSRLLKKLEQNKQIKVTKSKIVLL
jgi:CRP/FNR family transcriptional regulator, anaerobic regulatory protein